ncbi:uncharacterized protein LOC144419933 [Styela clava]
MVFWFLVVAAILRFIVTVSVLLLDWFCKTEKCCSDCNNPHAQTLIILELLADLVDLAAASIYLAYNKSSKLEESIPGERLCGRFGAAFFVSWIRGALAIIKGFCVRMIKITTSGDDESAQSEDKSRCVNDDEQ